MSLDSLTCKHYGICVVKLNCCVIDLLIIYMAEWPLENKLGIENSDLEIVIFFFFFVKILFLISRHRLSLF